MADYVASLLRRPWRIAAILLAVVAVGLIALILRTLNAAGTFNEVKAGFDGSCRKVAGLAGGEDIAIDPLFNIAFVSATDRRAPPDRPNPQDGIYVMRVDHPELGVTKVSGTPANFHPHGISLYRGRDGALTLMAVNHRAGDTPVVDIFDVSEIPNAAGGVDVKLVLRETAEGNLLTSPNDVVAVGTDRFYATNDHGSVTSFGRFLEEYLMLPRANVVYYDGDALHVAARDLRFPNGIAVSHDLSRIYVAETTGKDIKTYGRQVLSGELSEQNTFPLAAGPDNIDVGPNGNLWVAVHPKLLAYVAYARDPNDPSPSEIMRVRVKNGIPDEAGAIYTDLGHQIGAASVGAFGKGRLLIGSVFDPKILDCTLAQ